MRACKVGKEGLARWRPNTQRTEQGKRAGGLVRESLTHSAVEASRVPHLMRLHRVHRLVRAGVRRHLHFNLGTRLFDGVLVVLVLGEVGDAGAQAAVVRIVCRT